MTIARLILSALIGTLLLSGCSDSGIPNIEGTWRPVSHTLCDGSVLDIWTLLEPEFSVEDGRVDNGVCSFDVDVTAEADHFFLREPREGNDRGCAQNDILTIFIGGPISKQHAVDPAIGSRIEEAKTEDDTAALRVFDEDNCSSTLYAKTDGEPLTCCMATCGGSSIGLKFIGINLPDLVGVEELVVTNRETNERLYYFNLEEVSEYGDVADLPDELAINSDNIASVEIHGGHLLPYDQLNRPIQLHITVDLVGYDPVEVDADVTITSSSICCETCYQSESPIEIQLAAVAETVER